MVIARIRHIAAVTIALLTLGPALSAAPRPNEGPVAPRTLEEAQRHYQRGVELFGDNVYDASLVEFRRAYELAPSFKILYNIGQVSRQLDDYAAAVDAFERYLREGGTEIAPTRLAEVKKELEWLSHRVGKVQILCNVPRAEASVDDLPVARAPFSDPVTVNSGRRKVTAIVEGQSPMTRIVDVVGGDTVKVSFSCGADAARPARSETPRSNTASRRETDTTARQTTTPPSSDTATASSASPSTNRDALWIYWTGTAVLAVGAVTTGILAVRAENDVEGIKRLPASSPAAFDDAHGRMRTFSITTDVLAGLAVVAGAFAIYETVATSQTKSTVGFGIGAGGLLVHGSY